MISSHLQNPSLVRWAPCCLLFRYISHLAPSENPRRRGWGHREADRMQSRRVVAEAGGTHVRDTG